MRRARVFEQRRAKKSRELWAGTEKEKEEKLSHFVTKQEREREESA